MFDATGVSRWAEVAKLRATADLDGKRVQVPLGKHIEAEITRDDQCFVRLDGQWCTLRPKRAEAIHEALCSAKRLYPPAWANIEARNEAEWNKKAATAIGGTLLDTTLLRIPGAGTPVELCDIQITGNLGSVHVKRLAGSASKVTHVLAQANAAASAYHEDAAADFLAEHVGSRDVPTQVTIVLLDERSDPSRPLPYLLAQPLLSTLEQLRSMGFVAVWMTVPWKPKAT